MRSGETQYLRRIVSQKKMAGTKTGARAQLECGHTVIIFGDQRHIDGKVLCLKCYADRQ